MNRYIILVIISALLVSSCKTTEKVLYLQDIDITSVTPVNSENTLITIQPKDMISIVVSSKDPEMASKLNLPIVAYEPGRASNAATSRISGYTVSENGEVDFPMLGTMRIAGLTKSQVATLIKDRLIDNGILNDPIVTVDFMNLYLTVMGEVRNPGRFMINRDQISIMEALGMAGDLTIHGKRDGIYVIREEGGVRVNYHMDLRSAEIFNSPAYYVKQNDVIYVQPNKVRAGQSTVNENNVRSVSLWISIASFLTTFGILLQKK